MFRVFSYKEIIEFRLTKGKLFADLKITFDYALPQNWLDEFSKFCQDNPIEGFIVTYDLIASSTVWAYPRFRGFPLFGCREVLKAYKEFKKL